MFARVGFVWWMENVLKYMYIIYFEKKEQVEGGMKNDARSMRKKKSL